MTNVSARHRSFVSGALPRRALVLLGLTPLCALLWLIAPTSVWASGRQVALFEEDSVIQDPGPVLQELRHLGAGEIRLVIHWTDLAPDPTSPRRPRFNAADPGAYSAAAWSAFDAVVRQAQADGIKVLVTIASHAPQWAFGPGEPGGSVRSVLGAWKPSASEYGQFVQAVGTRYSGHYHGLPRVSAWQIYSEPNFGEDLSPQSVGPVYTAAVTYRSLVGAAWTALQRSGHRHDTILIGALAARGEKTPRITGETPPLDFVRELYCLDAHYRPFRGRAAGRHHCPRSTATFRRQNPGLFNASGFAVHPYPLGPDMRLAPNRTRSNNPNYAAFAQLPRFTQGLDQALRADGSHKHFPIWNTEYGYVSNPPRGDGVSLVNQAYFLNWAEYLSWKNPRIASFMQFLLVDPDPTHGVFACGGFASGLLFTAAPARCVPAGDRGAPKPALAAWRLPLYMPRTSTRRGHTLEVWGCVRPAPYAFSDTHRSQFGQLQFSSNHGRRWSTLATVLANHNCYFDRRIRFQTSGIVRLAYSYPIADTRLKPTLAARYFNPFAPSVSRSISVRVR